MPWQKVDDKYRNHPKIEAAGPLATLLDVLGMNYCADLATDGFVPRTQVRKLADWDDVDGEGTSVDPFKLIDRLVTVGRWERDADRDGYRIHDFLDYHPSRAEAQAVSVVRAEAGRRGGQRSGEVRRERAQQPERPEHEVASPVASEATKQIASPELEAPANPVPTRPDPSPTQDVHGSAGHALAPPAPAQRKATGERYSADFERFWTAYPYRPNNPKAPAYQSWCRCLRDGDSAETMVLGATNYATHCAIEGKTGTEYVAQAATFLRQRRFEEFSRGVPEVAMRASRPATNGHVQTVPRGFPGIAAAVAKRMPRTA